MPGRFQVYGGRVRPDEAAHPLRWRLVSDNGRLIAVGASEAAAFDEAVAAARLVQAEAAAGTVLLTTPTREGWGWYLVGSRTAPDVVLATSARRFARRLECMESITRFRSLAATASLPQVSLAFRRAPQPLRSHRE